MVERIVTVHLKTGLHARPAALFVQEANKYTSEIFVSKENKKVNAKSIMGIMSLAVSHGSEITISADGSDAEQAIEALSTIVGKDDL
ncbi:HPr family phosphocarrier protein [Marininema halotolerans]|uniref:Phosphocarrier protein HPr n=1 Tax=Marininema halotolerans TaxID=1155944 RepID=A0A1I6NWJ4_9BACL|nr:HPr family phosphocarrier protein [Marininema halotolerans]SFS32323.1 catabolite repression HPr-like protein [Marininema halotolerans]